MQFTDRIARRMKLHDLHILMAVVQAGSMNKAAAVLNMTQPAVSRSIAELERTVGVSCSIASPRRRADCLRSCVAQWRNGRIRRSAPGLEGHRVSCRPYGGRSPDRLQFHFGHELCFCGHRAALTALSENRLSLRNRID